VGPSSVANGINADPQVSTEAVWQHHVHLPSLSNWQPHVVRVGIPSILTGVALYSDVVCILDAIYF
jgi:hypothetical protein